MNFLWCLALQEKKLDDSSRLNVVEIALVHVSKLVSFLVGLRTFQHPDVLVLYLVLLHVSAVYFSQHQVGIMIHKKGKRGETSPHTWWV